MDPSEGAPRGFNAVYLIKKVLESDSKSGCKEGVWDGTHIVMCQLVGGEAHYTVLSTVQINIQAQSKGTYGDITISGTCQKTMEKKFKLLPGIEDND